MKEQYKIKLSEIVEYQKGFAFKAKDYQNNGFGIIRVSDFEKDTVNLDNIYYVSEKIAMENKKYQVKTYDILITTVGASAGNFILVPEEADGLLLNQNIVRIRLKSNNKLEQIYLFYLLKNLKFTKYLVSGASGSAQASITLEQILGTEIYYLKDEKRNNISELLYYFYKKIVLNPQINQTLEQMAQAIFKHWFIDFAPVHAKAEVLAQGGSEQEAEQAAMQSISGKTAAELTALSQTNPTAYQQLQQTAAAFPSELVDSELGLVPKEWEVGNIKNITKSRREKVKNEDVKVLSAISSGELVLSQDYFSKQVYSKSIEKYLKVYPYDFAFNPSRINIGSIGLHKKIFIGAVSPVYEVFSVNNKYKWFLERFLRLEDTINKINLLCSGSVRQSLKLKDLQSIKIIIPNEIIIEKFNTIWEIFYEKIQKNNFQSKTLAQTRDTLLPKLLNGEIEL